MKRRRAKRKKLEKSLYLKEYVIQKLREDWSPEQISGELKRLSRGKNVLSHESIYLFVYSAEGRQFKLWKHLRHRGKYMHLQRRHWGSRKKRKTSIPNRVSIHKRPSFIEKNTKGEIDIFGHWEADLMIFSQERQTLAVFVERKTKKTFSVINNDKSSAQMKLALYAFIESQGIQNIHSITFDKGLENICHQEIREEYNNAFDTYFCDPYSSWQKGFVENTNKLLRQYSPRKILSKNLNQDRLDFICTKLNNRPRKNLHFLTPRQSFLSCSL